MDNTALITGSSSGLGDALCKIFLEKNMTVLGLSRSKSINTTSQIECDFSDLSSIKGKLDELTQNTSHIKYVFLNAGILGKIDYNKNISIDDYNLSWNINVLSNKIILDRLLSHFTVDNVIGISSGAAFKTYLGWSLYCTTKAAFKQLISAYSDEFPNTNFVSLAPGLIKSNMQKEIKKIDSAQFPSVEKFHAAFDTMSTPKETAEKIIANLDYIFEKKQNNFIDLRNIP